MEICRSERIKFRQFELTDVPTVYAYSKEEGIVRWISNQVYEDIDEAEDTIAYLMSRYTRPYCANFFPYVLGIELISTGELIGHIGLSEIPEGIEIGYAICDKYKKMGLGSEAVNYFSGWAKTFFCIDKIYGVADSKNIASVKTLQRAGFNEIQSDKYAAKGQKIYIR